MGGFLEFEQRIRERADSMGPEADMRQPNVRAQEQINAALDLLECSGAKRVLLEVDETGSTYTLVPKETPSFDSSEATKPVAQNPQAPIFMAPLNGTGPFSSEVKEVKPNGWNFKKNGRPRGPGRYSLRPRKENGSHH